MFTYRELVAEDLLKSNLINLDSKTASFPLSFYIDYLCNNNKNCLSVWNSKTMAGYLIGSSGEYPETKEKYSHVTALSVSPLFRKCGLGTALMNALLFNAQSCSSKFIDLFVRTSNSSAISFYTKNSYKIHRKIDRYYNAPDEDAYDMRKYLC